MEWTPLQIAFASGLMQKADDRSRPSTALDIALDCQFDELGGIQTRLPFAALGSNISGGGAISTARRIVAYGDELLLFSKDTLYSWNPQLSVWVSRGTHLAIKVDEEPMFVATGDQVNCDRAELSNVIAYCWTDTAVVYVATVDKTTGAVLMPPTAMASSGTRPRVVALTTKILLTYLRTSGDFTSRFIDPATPTTVSDSQDITTAANIDQVYDITKIIGADAAIGAYRRDTNTSYTVFKITTSTAPVVTAALVARPCSGALAVSSTPDGLQVQIVRVDATGIEGDLITISGFADTAHINKAIHTLAGGGANSIACAHRSVQNSSQYRCYIFWDEDLGSAGDANETDISFNYVDTGGTVGASAVFVRALGVASRAFDYDGSVYLWCVFAGASAVGGQNFRAALQNTYFLYRDDALLCAKAAGGDSGGFAYTETPGTTTAMLPGVGLVSGTTGFAWCGTERRIIDLGGNGHSGYADRGPLDITFTFDSNAARRTARAGKSLYVTGGEVLAYDGVRLSEVGFHIYPWMFETANSGTGSLVDGSYTYKQTLRWANATGESERSTTATTTTQVVSAGPRAVSVGGTGSSIAVYTTHKKASVSSNAANETWRTPVNPVIDTDFYLVTSKDPAGATPNGYTANDTTAAFITLLDDRFADATLITKEANPENGGVLENLAPPPASLIAANDTRVFLAGASGDPNRVWYSKQRSEGQIAAFHDGLTCDVPPAGGDITAIAFLNETLVVFRERAIYALPGDGLDNLGGGQNFGPARIVSLDCGAESHEAVALSDRGLIFKSSKGWYVLNKGWSLEYIGAAVSDYDDETVMAIHAIESRHQIRCLTTDRMLVLDTLVNQWSEWTIEEGLDAAIWNGTYAYLVAAGPRTEQTTYTSLTYGMDIETAWIKMSDLQGSARIRRLLVLGEYRSTHLLRVRVARDYEYASEGVPDYFDDRSWPVTPTTVGGTLQVKHGPSRQQCEAFKVRLTAVGASLTSAPVLLSDGILTWNATLSGAPGRTISISFLTSTTASVTVRDDQRHASGAWTADPNNCGVYVTGNITTAPVTVAVLEAAITASSDLVSVSSPYGTQGALLAITTLTGTVVVASFSAASPTGEALKLTGLGLEVGAKPGLHRRLPVAQKT